MGAIPAGEDPVLAAAAEALARARHAIALTGAGLSVESGIPPFRGPGGLWTKHGEPPLDGWQRFLDDPKAFWESRLQPTGPLRELARAVEAARPNPGHEAFVELERIGVLRCLVTQNIDGLHGRAGQRELAEIHGNARLVRCIECGSRWPREEIPTAVLPPLCPRCGGLVKADTVSFGEPIPADVFRRSMDEAEQADCIVVAGTSATVYPAASLPHAVLGRRGVVIEVNPHESELSTLATFVLRGPAGEVLPRLVRSVRARLA